jgi:hypothetical protein
VKILRRPEEQRDEGPSYFLFYTRHSERSEESSYFSFLNTRLYWILRAFSPQDDEEAKLQDDARTRLNSKILSFSAYKPLKIGSHYEH